VAARKAVSQVVHNPGGLGEIQGPRGRSFSESAAFRRLPSAEMPYLYSGAYASPYSAAYGSYYGAYASPYSYSAAYYPSTYASYGYGAYAGHGYGYGAYAGHGYGYGAYGAGLGYGRGYYY